MLNLQTVTIAAVLFSGLYFESAKSFRAARLGGAVTKKICLYSSENRESDRPPIIPFDFGADFARADIVVTKSTTASTPRNTTAVSQKNQVAKQDEMPQDQNVEDAPSNIFDVLFSDSSNDSREKKQARFTIRSITVLSVLMGIIFTAVWYLFPGRFVSFRGASDLPVEQESVNRIVEDDSSF